MGGANERCYMISLLHLTSTQSLFPASLILYLPCCFSDGDRFFKVTTFFRESLYLIPLKGSVSANYFCFNSFSETVTVTEFIKFKYSITCEGIKTDLSG